MNVTLRSYSKINLGLAIGPVRGDGFHALTTLYQTLAAHDRVGVELRARHAGDPAITISSNDVRVPLDGANTAHRMIELALAAPGRAGLAVHVHIEKRLPVQGGMAAGSANAVAALVGLERLIARAGAAAPLSGAERLELAAKVGSDVPLFLLGGTVLGTGRGEQVVPVPEIGPVEAVVALPPVGVSTPAAFRAWDDEQAGLGLTSAAMTGRLDRLSCALASALCETHTSGVFAEKGRDLAGTLLSSLVQTGTLQNDFEQVVFRQHPLLSEIKQSLAGTSHTCGCLYAALSGSGAAVFGLYGSPDAAEAAVARLDTIGISSFRTRTLGRETYWPGMVENEG